MEGKIREVKVCLLGESGVGKSSLVLRFVYDSFSDNIESTIGASFLSKTLVVDGQTYRFRIWDTAGQEKYRSLAPMYYRNADAAVIMYDVTSPSSFQYLRAWLREVQSHGPDGVVIALVGNKTDLADAREVTFEDAEKFAKSQGAIFAETSAKTSSQVEDVFMRIARSLKAEVPASGSGYTLGAGARQEQTGAKRKCSC